MLCIWWVERRLGEIISNAVISLFSPSYPSSSIMAIVFIRGIISLLALFYGTSTWAWISYQNKSPPYARSVQRSSSVYSVIGSDECDACKSTLVRALEKMQLIQTPGFAPMASFNKRRMSLVEIKQSSISGAGLGLFAKKNIKAGTIVSFYPTHMIGIDYDGMMDNRLFVINSLGETYERRQDMDDDQTYLHNILGKRLLLKTDVIETLGGQSIFIDVDPSREGSPTFLSHRVNDGATVQANLEDELLKYYRESRKAKNCVHVPFGPSPLLATVATKKLAKGEELFTTYGCSYWIEHLHKNNNTGDIEMTDEIILEAREVAKDILIAMQGVAVTDAEEAAKLCAIFDL